MVYMDKIDPSVEAFFGQKIDDVPLPKALRLQLTAYCNMACTMCPCSHNKDRTVISKEVLSKIVEVCAPHIKTVGISYLGEPTLHPDFWGIVRFLSEHGHWEIGLQTNGTTLSKITPQKIIKVLAATTFNPGVFFIKLTGLILASGPK